MKPIIYILLLAIALGLTQCCKEKPGNNNNACHLLHKQGLIRWGFLLNGEPWVPAGNNGTANLSMDFDPGFNNGILNIAAYSSKNLAISQLVLFVKDSLNSLSVVPFTYNIGKRFLGGDFYRLKFL